MKKTKIIMGMPIAVEVVDGQVKDRDINDIFDYFKYIDQKFSTYKKSSEVSMINDARLKIEDSSKDMKTIFKLAEKTKKETNGYFDIYHNKKYDPSGIVKGWAIFEAFKTFKNKGYKNFYIDCGGDVQVLGHRLQGRGWRIGIKNPFKQTEIIKTVFLKRGGVATSGNYIRGEHIYNPRGSLLEDIVSLSVIGPNIYEADRFATAAFAMGKRGINFIERLTDLEGYMIDKNGIATMTSGFGKYTIDT